MKKNVLLTGGTGFIGRYLSALLLEKGYSVSILTRVGKENTESISYYTWDVVNGEIDEASVLNADYIIHLAGENIGEKRWTSKRKDEIINSREQSVALIYSVLQANNKKLDAFVSASAIGIYGAYNGEGICTEDTRAADDFLGSTCQKWEKSLSNIENLGIRTVKVRAGLVLGREGGFLKKMAPIFKYGFGAALGSGKQYVPWIHVYDLSLIYIEALTNSNMRGAYNAVIEDGTNSTIFSKSLAKIYGYSLWLPNVPEFVLKLAMGEMSKIALTGRKVSSDKIKNIGFRFVYKDLNVALKESLC